MASGRTPISTVRGDDDIAAARALVLEFFGFLRDRYPDMTGNIDRYMAEQDVAGQLERFRATFLPPHGECFLASHDGAFVGIVALKLHSPARGEMNRMYVRAAARGLGLGRALGRALIDEARRLGVREVILDGLHRHVEALPLYRSLGFEDYTDPAAFEADDFPGYPHAADIGRAGRCRCALTDPAAVARCRSRSTATRRIRTCTATARSAARSAEVADIRSISWV